MKKMLAVLATAAAAACFFLAGTATVQAKPGFGPKCPACHTAKPPKKENVKKPCDCAGAKPDKKAACEKACK